MHDVFYGHGTMYNIQVMHDMSTLKEEKVLVKYTNENSFKALDE